MKKYQLLSILLAVMIATAGCGQEEVVFPIPEDALIPILMDVHIAEAAIQGLHGEEKDSVAAAYYEQIEKIHGYERALIDSCIVLMRKDPKVLSANYGKLLEEISKKEAELKK